MNLLDLMIEIGVDDKASAAISSISESAKSKIAGIGSAAKTGFAALSAAAAGGVTALFAVESATEEYRVAQGKLNAAFETAGYGADAAKQSYSEFYKIIGDTDTAAEASQLLAKLADSQEDLSTWTNIATGVVGTFGDALPINSLIEAANETSKTGTVVGVLADALNWAGISEDDFNASLAACGDESERNQLIMDTLSGTYSEAADSFRSANSTIMESRESQVKLEEAMSKVGEAVANLKNSVISAFGPAFETASTALSDFLNDVDVAGVMDTLSGAFQKIQEVLSPITSAVSELAPVFQDFFESLSENGSPVLDALSGALSSIASGVGAAIGAFGSVMQTYLIPAFQAAQPAIKAFLQAIQNAQPVIQLIGTVIGTVAGIIGTVLVTAFTVVIDIITTVINAISGFVSFILGVPESVGEFFNGVVNWFSQLPGSIASFLSNVISNIASWVSDMVAKALEAGQGFLDSVNQKFQEVINFFTNLPQNILNALGDLGSLLWDAGKSIIDGLWNGLKSAWEGVTGWFGEITSMIPGLKGPVEVDAKLLLTNGEAIMGGLLNGLERGWGDVEKFLGNVTADIPSVTGTKAIDVEYNYAAEPVRSNQNPQVVNNYYIGDTKVTATDEKQFAEQFVALMERYGRLAYT